MKKIIFYFSIIFVFNSCTTEPGSLKVTVSYYYNTYQGYKPDVGAKVFLFLKSETTSFHNDSTNPIIAKAGMLQDYSGDIISGLTYKYSGITDGSGNCVINDIEPEDYLLIVASNGRTVYSHKYITINEGQQLSLGKSFYYLHDYEDGGEYW